MNEIAKKLEALLLISGESISYKEAAELLGCTTDEARQWGQVIAESLRGHGFGLVMSPGEMSLTTSPDTSEWIAGINHNDLRELSAAAAETLAIVAYRGPISQSDVSAIRGVDCRRMLRQLKFSGLVEQNEEGEVLYQITGDFLQKAGYCAVTELPDFEALSNNKKIDEVLTNQAGHI